MMRYFALGLGFGYILQTFLDSAGNMGETILRIDLAMVTFCFFWWRFETVYLRSAARNQMEHGTQQPLPK